MAAPQFSSEPPLPAIMATHDERDSRPSAPGRLAGGLRSDGRYRSARAPQSGIRNASGDSWAWLYVRKVRIKP